MDETVFHGEGPKKERGHLKALPEKISGALCQNPYPGLQPATLPQSVPGPTHPPPPPRQVSREAWKEELAPSGRGPSACSDVVLCVIGTIDLPSDEGHFPSLREADPTNTHPKPAETLKKKISGPVFRQARPQTPDGGGYAIAQGSHPTDRENHLPNPGEGGGSHRRQMNPQLGPQNRSEHHLTISNTRSRLIVGKRGKGERQR